ncbi:sensor histidine kinase [Streptomyces justiciae]|uniref:sensor histidine kinase n=1 Tax=Streptomyces justiciae TaxID=2780140 RepID=UPI002AD20FAA|nr:HAMP domain-containing sensor histidine kinase [Streptomyces justiciae]
MRALPRPRRALLQQQAQSAGGTEAGGEAAGDTDDKPEPPLTGDIKAKAEAAALAAYPGTVEKSEEDAEKPGEHGDDSRAGRPGRRPDREGSDVEPLAAEQYVAVDIAGAPVGQVWAIPGALEQIIDNLVANALRVSPPGTTITLARTPGSELHVVDQGPGMPASERERAFDRFWRASATHHDGTGLGLPIVRHLVTASGGEITLNAAPGGGLDAHVRLRPVADGRPRTGRGAAPAAQARATTR